MLLLMLTKKNFFLNCGICFSFQALGSYQDILGLLCNLKSEALGRKLPDWPVWRNSLRMIKGHSSEGGGHSPHSGLSREQA